MKKEVFDQVYGFGKIHNVLKSQKKALVRFIHGWEWRYLSQLESIGL